MILHRKFVTIHLFKSQEKELFTQEEIAASDLRVSMMVEIQYIRVYQEGEDRQGSIISNRIFEAVFTDYFAAKKEYRPNGKRSHGVIYQDVMKDGKFDMAACICKLTDERRMDIVVDFEKEQYIVELKNGKAKRLLRGHTINS